MTIRVAFVGASGTGKTTLSKFIEATYKVPFNPIGSRSVAAAMGFASPYDVDKAGKRAEFQRRLVTEKLAWEAGHEAFVTDRTPLDNLAYTLMHDVKAIDAPLLKTAVLGLSRYTHIFYCPVGIFCNPGDDPARVKDQTYHELYDLVVKAMLIKYRPAQVRLGTLTSSVLIERKGYVSGFL